MYETITDKINDIETIVKNDESRIKMIHQDILFNRGYVAALIDVRHQFCEADND